jgi:hypothetical protein
MRDRHSSGINLSMCVCVCIYIYSVYIYIPYECLSLTKINQFFKHLKDYTTHGNTHTPKSGIPLGHSTPPPQAHLEIILLTLNDTLNVLIE